MAGRHTKFCRLFLLGVLGAAIAIPAHAGKEPWRVDPATEVPIRNYLRNSVVGANLKTNDVPNHMVYPTKERIDPMMHTHEMLACIHLTNPKAKLDIDTGGGLAVDIDKAKFANGIWAATVRMSEQVEIDGIDKFVYYTLTKVQIGKLTFTEPEDRAEAVWWLTQECVEKPKRKKQAIKQKKTAK